MKVQTTCGVLALVAALTGSALAQDSHTRNAQASLQDAQSGMHVVAASSPAIEAASAEHRTAGGGPSPLGYLGIGSGAALAGCVWLSRRYRAEG